MLLGFVTALSLVLAVLGCLGGTIWLLPVYFVGSFVGLLLLAVLFLVVVSYIVDPDKEQEKDNPFYRWVIAVYIEALVKIMQVRIHTEGLEKTPKEGRFLLVCNHQCVADPVVLLHHFRDSQLAFISKQENRDLFCVGRLMHKILCQPLDRENDRQALKVILKCIQIIKEDKASIAVFPEGATNSDDKLHPFRPGVFKIAQKANVPIVVCTLNNTIPIIKNGLRLKPTDVTLHLVGVIPPEDLKGRTAVDISNQVYEMMLADLGAELKYVESVEEGH